MHHIFQESNNAVIMKELHNTLFGACMCLFALCSRVIVKMRSNSPSHYVNRFCSNQIDLAQGFANTFANYWREESGQIPEHYCV